MKLRLFKMLAAVGAMTLVLGTSAFAAGSPTSTDVTPPAAEPGGMGSLIKGEQSPIAKKVAELGGGKYWLGPHPGGIGKYDAKGVKSSKNYVGLLWDGEEWINLPNFTWTDGAVAFSNCAAGDFLVVEVGSGSGSGSGSAGSSAGSVAGKSPATGQATSMALITAIFALAGAAVCFKKYSFSK